MKTIQINEIEGFQIGSVQSSYVKKEPQLV